MGQGNYRIIAEFSLTPLGVGTSVSKYVAEAHKAIKDLKNIRLQLTPMSTIIEASTLDDVYEAIKRAHEAVLKTGVQRLDCFIKIDDRRDKPRRMEDKVDAVRKLL